MPFRSLPIANSARFSRAVAVAALLGGTMLAGSLGVARAAPPAPSQFAQATTTTQPPGAAQTQTAPGSQTQTTPGSQQENSAANAQQKADTIEQRINDLHAALQITPQEEPKWDHVAKVMRDNASAMDKLVAERDSQASEGMTAVENLQQYEKFAQAHVTHLKKLTTAFDALYTSMPPTQQKVADQVFQNFGHNKGGAAHG